MKKLMCTIVIMSLMSACAKSSDSKTPEQTITFNDVLDCSDIEKNLVDGLPPVLGQTPAYPSKVQEGIKYYRNIAAENPDIAYFYTTNANLMESKLNLFNERFIKECK